MNGFSFETHTVNGVSLNVASAGDPAAPMILCLHGFPEYWGAWAPVMRQLAKDYRVVAPDQRGFNRSSKPEGVDAYRVKHLVADLAALADRLSPGEPFVLAGHDWGASVAYALAFSHPERLTHLVIANGVHPWCFQNAIIHDEAQRRASQYINRLRDPRSDVAMAEDGFARTLRMLSGFSRTDWMGDAEREAYIDAWSQPGAIPAMLNWYRATPLVVPLPGEIVPEPSILTMDPAGLTVRVPHLLLWGEADEALRPSTLQGLERFAPDLTVKRFADSGHWILHEKPAEVAKAILDFLSRP